jgi:putative Mg2+ transporter-C (MgtC) family protein
MQALQNINLLSLLDTFVSLLFAFVLGSLIGLERQYRQRTAGLRTNALVAIGAAAFVDMANRLMGHAGAVQVTAYVVSGVGFLGAGTIMKEGANVRGLNTAATLWGSAAVGACAGADLIVEAVLATLFVLAANTLLRPVVNAINRQPISEEASEVTYSVYVICESSRQKEVRAQLEAMLEAASYPVRDLDIHPFGASDVEITATLLATSVEAEQLDAITNKLVGEAYISQAFWTPSATD